MLKKAYNFLAIVIIYVIITTSIPIDALALRPSAYKVQKRQAMSIKTSSSGTRLAKSIANQKNHQGKTRYALIRKIISGMLIFNSLVDKTYTRPIDVARPEINNSISAIELHADIKTFLDNYEILKLMWISLKDSDERASLALKALEIIVAAEDTPSNSIYLPVSAISRIASEKPLLATESTVTTLVSVLKMDNLDFMTQLVIYDSAGGALVDIVRANEALAHKITFLLLEIMNEDRFKRGEYRGSIKSQFNKVLIAVAEDYSVLGKELMPQIINSFLDENIDDMTALSLSSLIGKALESGVEISPEDKARLTFFVKSRIKHSNKYFRYISISLAAKVCGEEALGILTEEGAALANESLWVRFASIDSMADIAVKYPNRAQEVFQIFFRDMTAENQDYQIRLELSSKIKSMLKTNLEQLTPEIKEALRSFVDSGIRHEDSSMRRTAVSLVYDVYGYEALDIILSEGTGINDKDGSVRSVSIDIVGEIVVAYPDCAKDTIPILVIRLVDEDYDVRNNAKKVLSDLMFDVTERADEIAVVLMENYPEQEEANQTAIVRLLGEHASAYSKLTLRVWSFIKERLSEENEIIRSAAVKAIVDMASVKQEQKEEAITLITETVRDKSPEVRSASINAWSRIGGERAIRILGESDGIGINDKDEDVSTASAAYLSNLLLKYPDFITEKNFRALFKHASIPTVRRDIKAALKIKRELFLSLTSSVFDYYNLQKDLRPSDVNILIHLILQKGVPAETKNRAFKVLYECGSEKENKLTRMIYLFILDSILKKHDEDGLDFIKDRNPDIVAGLQELFSENIDPPYDEIFDIKKNPNQELNIRLYNPLDSDYLDSALESEGYSKQINGELIVYRKTINGKKVNIYCDPRGDPKNYKGEIFTDMGNLNIPIIVYSGHTGMGAALSMSLDKSPQVDMLQAGSKIIIILSCDSARCYLGSIKLRYPYSHFIGTKNPSSTEDDTAALVLTIEGICNLLPYPDIKKRVYNMIEERKEKYFYVAPKRFDDDYFGRDTEYLFSHEPERFDYMDLNGDGMPDRGGNSIVFFPATSTIFLADNDTFDFESGSIDLSRIRTEKISGALSRVIYFFGTNDFLKDIIKDKIRPSGIKISYSDLRDACLIEESTEDGKKVYDFALNAGYRNKSEAALIMMGIYEGNMHFAKAKKGETNIFDKLRGLQLVAEFVKTYHKEEMFSAFLQKYGYDSIPLDILIKTLDNNPDNVSVDPLKDKVRIDALKDVLKQLDHKDSISGITLKEEGLLSFHTVPGQGIFSETPQHDFAFTGAKFAVEDTRAIYEAAKKADTAIPKERLKDIFAVLKDLFKNSPEVLPREVLLMPQRQMDIFGAKGEPVVRYQDSIVIAQEYYDQYLSTMVTNLTALRQAKQGITLRDPLLKVLMHEAMTRYTQLKGLSAEDIGMLVEGILPAEAEDWQRRRDAHLRQNVRTSGVIERALLLSAPVSMGQKIQKRVLDSNPTPLNTEGTSAIGQIISFRRKQQAYDSSA